MSTGVALVLLVAGFATPARYVLPLVPALLVLAHAVRLGPLVEYGPVALAPYDPVLVGAGARVLITGLRVSRRAVGGAATVATAAYVGAMLPAIAASSLALGAPYALDRGVALARFALEASIVPAMALSVRTADDVRFLERSLVVLGVVAAASIYIDFLGPWTGVTLGEFQVSGEGAVRSFGIVGDQVGYLLGFFFLLMVLRRRPAAALFFLLAIVLTVGLGAMLCLAVGLAVLLRGALRSGGPGRRPVLTRRQRVGLVGVAGACLVVAVLAGRTLVGDRLSGGGLAQGSGLQRLLTMTVAVDVVRDSPAWGAGYMGLLPASLRQASTVALLTGLGGADAPAGFVANANNQYLEALVDGGPLALVALVALLWTAARLLRRADAALAPAGEPLAHAGAVWVTAMALGTPIIAWLLPGSLLAVVFHLLFGAAAGIVAGEAVPTPPAAGRTLPLSLAPS